MPEALMVRCFAMPKAISTAQASRAELSDTAPFSRSLPLASRQSFTAFPERETAIIPTEASFEMRTAISTAQPTVPVVLVNRVVARYSSPSNLAIDTAGTLFGTTYGGGAFGAGTVFSLVP